MQLDLTHIKDHISAEIQLTTSKSESNRALIIQALSQGKIELKGLAAAEDTVTLQRLLNDIAIGEGGELNVGLAGTVMRFLTAYLAITPGQWLLTGEQRMKERPIGILVDALKTLGAEIEYMEKVGYPPLKISGKNLDGQEVTIAGDVSSQFISALLLIGPYLKGGLTLQFTGELLSKPYIQMTVDMMKFFGAKLMWLDAGIRVEDGAYKNNKIFQVEADWSAASYYYGFAALSEEVDITIKGLNENSLQGDSIVSKFYAELGVETTFENDGIHLHNIDGFVYPDELEFDFTHCPDIAQTVAVSCAALNIKTKLTGLKTLRIKETDRVSAVQIELNKLGFHVEVERNDIIIHPVKEIRWNKSQIETYNDHRMAMAFAPLALLGELYIYNPEVVKKSYPKFWEDVNLLV